MDARIGRPTVLYVCSASRCGSTVFDMFMGGHSEVASLGELNMLGKVLRVGRPCSCGQPFASCSAWIGVFDQVFQRTHRRLEDDPYALPLWDARAKFHVDRERQTRSYERSVAAKNAWMWLRGYAPAPLSCWLPLAPGRSAALRNKMLLYSAVSQAWRSPVVVDSSKNAQEAIELARLWPRQVRVVLLTRDGRGVYYSHRSTGMARPDSLRSWSSYYTRSAPMIQRHVPPAQLMTLRYEDFAAKPEETARHMCDWLELPHHAGMAALEGDRWHMVDGNVTRFAPKKGIRLDERWRNGLPADEAEFFEHAAGDLNRRLGYT